LSKQYIYRAHKVSQQYEYAHVVLKIQDVKNSFHKQNKSEASQQYEL